MEMILPIFVFLFGLIIGSFLNVVAIRFNTGTNIGGRSRCMACGKQLTWKELIPIFSFLYQKGRCLKCGSKISWQYPLVEFVTGLLFVLIFLFYPPITSYGTYKLILLAILSSILVVISVYDIKHKIIPDILVYTFIILSFINLFVGINTWFQVPTVNGILAGPILALPFALIWLISKGTWMGFGDAKLVLGIGWLLGLGMGANSVILAFWIGALVSIAWLLINKGTIKPKTEIPFGPYLILGMYIVLFTGLEVIDFGLLKEILSSLFV